MLQDGYHQYCLNRFFHQAFQLKTNLHLCALDVKCKYSFHLYFIQSEYQKWAVNEVVLFSTLDEMNRCLIQNKATKTRVSVSN